MAPFLQVKVSLVNSAGGGFCWNYSTDTFYSNYAGVNVCCNYASGTFRYNCVGGFFCCNYVDDCFCCNYAVRNFRRIYAGKSFYSKYVGDNFYWNCAHGNSVAIMQVVFSAVQNAHDYFYCNYLGDCFCCSYVCDSFKWQLYIPFSYWYPFFIKLTRKH